MPGAEGPKGGQKVGPRRGRVQPVCEGDDIAEGPFGADEAV